MFLLHPYSFERFKFTYQQNMNETILKKIGKSEVDLTSISIIIDLHRIGNEGLQFLCSQQLSHVNNFSLAGHQITKEGMFHFPSAKWTSLVQLDLRENNIGNMGCKYISRASLNQIKELSINCNHIGSEGVLHLSKTQWSRLETLNLSENKVGVEGIRWLANAKWSNITDIHLDKNKLSERQLIQFVLCEFKTIRFIFIRRNVFIQERNYLKERLKQKWSTCSIRI